MKTKEFVAALDHGRITAAIKAAEAKSSGEIRVFVTHHATDDAVVAARAQFAKLEMAKTAARNGVLILLAPESRKVAVIGDQGVHELGGGEALWRRVVDETMRPLLREGKFTDAVVAAVDEVGRVLARHFPRAAGETDANELSDEVIED